MVLNQKPTGRASSVPAGLALGACVSMVVTLLGTAALAVLVDREVLAWEQVGWGILAMVLSGSFLGSLTAWSRIRRQRMLVCLLAGAVYFGLLLSVTALFFGGQYEAVGVTGLLVLAGSGCAALLGLGQGRGGRKVRLPHR